MITLISHRISSSWWNNLSLRGAILNPQELLHHARALWSRMETLRGFSLQTCLHLAGEGLCDGVMLTHEGFRNSSSGIVAFGSLVLQNCPVLETYQGENTLFPQNESVAATFGQQSFPTTPSEPAQPGRRRLLSAGIEPGLKVRLPAERCMMSLYTSSGPWPAKLNILITLIIRAWSSA